FVRDSGLLGGRQRRRWDHLQQTLGIGVRQVVRVEAALLAHDRVEVALGVRAERLVLLDQLAVSAWIGVLPPAPRVALGGAVERAAAVADREHPRAEVVARLAV